LQDVIYGRPLIVFFSTFEDTKNAIKSFLPGNLKLAANHRVQIRWLKRSRKISSNEISSNEISSNEISSNEISSNEISSNMNKSLQDKTFLGFKLRIYKLSSI
jgi:hypothetical protein